MTVIDKERLARLAKALDNRAKALVKTEEDRAMIAEAVLDEKINNKQDKTDNNLNTEDKTIVGAINELESEVFDIAANVISMDAYKADKTYVDEQLSNVTNNGITEAELDLLLEEIFGINSKNELTSVRLGNYQMKYDNVNDTLDFLYNGVIEEPTEEELDLDWIVGYSLVSTTGEPVVDADDAITDFILYDKSSEYFLSKDTVQNFRWYFYDSNKTFISRTENRDDASTINSKITFPENTAYFRLKLVHNGLLGSELKSHVSVKKTLSYVNNGLSLYIDADDVATYGSVRDITGKQNITNHGASLTSDNKYLNFISSESDYIDTDLVPNLSTWSVELYFCFTTTPTSTEIVTSWGSAWDNKVRLAYSGSSEGCGIESNDEQRYILFSGSELLSPHHLIITMNNGALTSYLDGVKTVLCASGGIQTSHTGTLKIGTKYDATKEFANINLRTFRFYDGKVLSDEEALQNYNYEINRNENIIQVTWIDNKNINYSGDENDDTSAMVTDYLTKENGYNYTINLTDVSSFKIYFFDSSKTFISRTNNLTVDSTDILIEFPENTSYFRLKSDKGTATVNNANDYIILKKVTK